MLLDLCRNQGRFLFLVSLRLPLPVNCDLLADCITFQASFKRPEIVAEPGYKTCICFYLFTWP